VPCSLVEPSGGPRDCHADETSYEIWWAGKCESRCSVKSESFDNGGQEVLEAIGSEMHVVHEAEQLIEEKNISRRYVTSKILVNVMNNYPNLLINKALTQALPYTGVLGSSIRSIIEDATVSKFSLLWCEPASLQWTVREREDGDYSDGV
jgi:hypothetical protein